MAAKAAPASGAKRKQARAVAHITSVPAFMIELVWVLEDLLVAVCMISHEDECLALAHFHSVEFAVTCRETTSANERWPHSLRLKKNILQTGVALTTFVRKRHLATKHRNINVYSKHW